MWEGVAPLSVGDGYCASEGDVRWMGLDEWVDDVCRSEYFHGGWVESWIVCLEGWFLNGS